MKVFRIAAIPASLDILLKGQLKFLNQYYEITAISSDGAELETIEKREGVQVKAINIERKISIFKDLISLWQLYLFFKKEKPEIIHSITPKAGLLSMMAAKFARVPIRIHTFTGLIFPTREGFMKKILIIMDKLLCYCATNIYPEGNGVKADLENYKITLKPLKVLANGNVNGVDLEYFAPNTVSELESYNLKKSLIIPHEDFVFIFVGRLVKDKGITELIAAFKNLNRKCVKLLLVGNYEEELDPLSSETIKEISSNPNIITVGFQKDVRPYFAISNALVFPSYREGFPNVVLQAGAMGLPSIVSNINGCNEIIIENENGTIIPKKDEVSLNLAMQKMAGDGQYYKNLQTNTRTMIVSRFEQSIVWEALLAEYNLITKHVQ